MHLELSVSVNKTTQMCPSCIERQTFSVVVQKIILLNDFTAFYQLTATVRQGEVTQQAVTLNTLEASHQLLCGNLSVTSTEKQEDCFNTFGSPHDMMALSGV